MPPFSDVKIYLLPWWCWQTVVKTRLCVEPRRHAALCCSGWLETMRSESQVRDKISFEPWCGQSDTWFTSMSDSRGCYVFVTRGKRLTKERLLRRSEVTLEVVLLMWRPVTGSEWVSVPLQLTGCIHDHWNKLWLRMGRGGAMLFYDTCIYKCLSHTGNFQNCCWVSPVTFQGRGKASVYNRTEVRFVMFQLHVLFLKITLRSVIDTPSWSISNSNLTSTQFWAE